MLEGIPFRGRECVCGRICAYYVADSSVTRFARATSSTLEEEIKKRKSKNITARSLIAAGKFADEGRRAGGGLRNGEFFTK